ncbi:hypothetical protein KAFR_0A01200 [Kazachstania africana CBS 2517]|uniref:Magnesium transporter n=1 Tax=Kazachstania africana (strain ATCC 22294 / BCRC 22015 / CBS 2517 / CECT 1963 / NBRC 1671 / NRRL Y-8276) TaxID=1071382 RepID=H2AMF9_KAZAF|nr:hypothetical protein KAFR_0A01200 [Kazachstania africana CBS 2517]CCF55559.1 hypothetical protein KAFR_0A01200 [Kazachstania africana CBS 2517]
MLIRNSKILSHYRYLGLKCHIPITQISGLHTTIKTLNPTELNNTTAVLLQKNLLQRNSSLHGYGSGTIRCTLFDGKGNNERPSIEMKKQDLVTLHGLLPRDLRKIERSKKNDLVPSLLVRQNGILISLLAIKALIKPDMVILFDSSPNGIFLNSLSQKNLISDLKVRLSNQNNEEELNAGALPFEFKALEAIFINAISNLTSEMKVLLTISRGILQDLEESITREKLRFLLTQSKKLTNFNKKVILLRDMIDDLLEQDDVLCSMYLTDWSSGKHRDLEDHDDIEMLLETYHNHIDEIVQMSESIISDIKATEEIINVTLDSNRNQLMLLGIKFSIGMVSIGGAMSVGSVYGMNLENFVEETNYGYVLAVTIGMVSTIWIYLVGIRHLHKLQKISLMNSLKKKRK